MVLSYMMQDIRRFMRQ